MKFSFVDRQLQLVQWDGLESGAGTAVQVSIDLRTLLVVDGDDAAGDAYWRLENPVVSQGQLFECAPAVVSVIMAALEEGCIPPRHLAACLDLLGRILAGYPKNRTQTVSDHKDLRRECHEAAMRGYWSLMRVACGNDEFRAWDIARSVLDVLDEDHARSFICANDQRG